jgi:two-component system CheB/CheR fusion protein
MTQSLKQWPAGGQGGKMEHADEKAVVDEQAAIEDKSKPSPGEPGPSGKPETESPGQPSDANGPAEKAFPIVGIGASAGGLAAFEAFFAGMPAGVDPGMAFILVQHLAPDHKSILAELIRRYTRMQVYEVEDGMRVEPNCAYIIPPNCDMALVNGSLQLLEALAPRGRHLPIDFFFRSLAEDQHERAVCIVLSGTGSDGTLGVRAIKGEGGMVMAQTPASTEYDGMPRNAIATGLVDYEMEPAAMATQLMAYASRAFNGSSKSSSDPTAKTQDGMMKVFVILRSLTGHDFSQYKPTTVHRRVERRLAVHRIESLELYVKFLESTPAEVEALFRDLLIGVTSFFRDPEAFQALETEVIPKLFDSRKDGATIRVWSPGCSTGEEAYSIAILLAERQAALRRNFMVQVFATDINGQSVSTARGGIYPASIAADMSPERLARFFTVLPDSGSYRIHKSIRDTVIFSEQDVIKDPPFSKLDLISCRNLMIYMSQELQRKLLPLFHYALNPGGFLFLGTSETVGEFGDLFACIDRRLKLYQLKTDPYSARRTAFNRAALFPATPSEVSFHRIAARTTVAQREPLRELTEQALLQHFAPAGSLVNVRGDILYLYGRTGLYLEPAPGESRVNNILRMAREGLRHELEAALEAAASTKKIVRRPGLQVRTNGGFTAVNLAIRPVSTSPGAPPESLLYMVILESVPASDPGRVEHATAAAHSTGEAAGPVTDAEERISALTQQLTAKERYLQTATEELETSNEDLKSANEEMQSVNEELQSTNEEMETAKEELHSTNEELTTINNELQLKLADLSHANNDMANLLAGTDIGIVFVDHQLHVQRFTPAARLIINLIPADVGRPVNHIVSNLLAYDSLSADIKTVLDTLVPKEMEVQTKDEKWYTMRIRPYRTLENVIQGAVITFGEVTEIVRAREALRKAANEMFRLAVVVRDANDAITMQALDGRTLAWNPGAVRMYGWNEAEALEMNVRDRIPEQLREEALAQVSQLSTAETLTPYATQRLAKDGSIHSVSIISTALINEAGQRYGIATTERKTPGNGGSAV